MKANKGEWSEFYAFLKILSDGQLPAADKNLEIIDGKYFIFKKIVKNEYTNSEINFHIKKDEIIIFNNENNKIKEISRTYINNKTENIFKKIENSSIGVFEIQEAYDLMEELQLKEIKANNTKKSDIDAVIVDRVSNKEDILGFSIKSMVGAASTLLNAGKTTNFVFEIKNFDKKYIKEINNIKSKSKIRDRVKSILDNGGSLVFDKVFKKEFSLNLKKIDTALPIFVSNMILNFYKGKSKKVVDLVNILSKDKRLNEEYELSLNDYEFKIKSFLIAVALGMVPSKEWDGMTKAHGGYIIVKNNSDVVCYHLYNREEFLEYLYRNTKFESASSERHNYGKIYEKNGKLYFNLNLQIRFLK